MSETQQRSDTGLTTQVPPEIQAAPQIPVTPDSAPNLAPTLGAQFEPAHASFAEFHEGYVSRYIELADTKAAWVFAIASGLIAYIFGSDELHRLIFEPAWSAPFVALLAATALLTLSAVFSFLVILPRLPTSEGIVYFGAVAMRKNADEYVRHIASKTEAELTEARLKHCYNISGVCVKKYWNLRLAIGAGVTSLICMCFVVILT